MRIYEAMFLFDPTLAADMSKVEQEVDRLMQRAGAEIIMSNKWDERKLAYEIEGRKRGTYVLTFFRADPQKITGIERDAQLSESVLRVLILKSDYMTEDDMKKAYGFRAQAAEPDGRPGRPAHAPAPAEAPAKTAPEPVAPAAVAEPGTEAPPATAPEVAESTAPAATVTEPEKADEPIEPQ